MRLLQLQLLLLLATTLSAQSFEELTLLRGADTPLSVRSAAMGAVSEDDIAANPTALASLKKPLFSAAAAQTAYDLDSIVLVDNIFALGVEHGLTHTSLSHLSVALPLRNGVVVSAYYRRQPELNGLTRFAGAGTADYPAVQGVFIYLGPWNFALQPALERRETHYGVTGSWERGNLAIGAGAELRDVDERIDVVAFRHSMRVEELGWLDRTSFRTKGRKIVPSVGLRWRATPRVTLGAGYTGSASFERTEDKCLATENNPYNDCISRFERIDSASVRTPDAYRASAAFAATDNLRLVGEAVRRNYSNYLNTFGERLKSVTELHAGAEYSVRGVALRAGWWRDPSHFDGPIYNHTLLAKTVDHLTFGAGIDVGKARVDVAYDNAERPAMRRASVGVTFNVQ